MAKKLVLYDVTKLVFIRNHKNFKEEIELDDIIMFKDMGNKIVIKSNILLDNLCESYGYNIVKYQKTKDYDGGVIGDSVKKSPLMELTKIENDYIAGKPSIITYVFENEEMRNINIKLNGLKSQKDDLATLLNLTVEMLKKESASNKN